MLNMYKTANVNIYLYYDLFLSKKHITQNLRKGFTVFLKQNTIADYYNIVMSVKLDLHCSINLTMTAFTFSTSKTTVL